MSSNVPLPTFTATGFQSPTEQDILAGVQADFNAAFGTTLNFGSPTNPTPQGQLAASMAAIIGAAYDNFCLLANSNDPAFANGRYQDAIARIYFLQRNPGQPTVAQCVCIGRSGTVIPIFSLIQNADGLQYQAMTTATIPPSGNVTIPFGCVNVGPTPCPANTLNIIFRTISGWDSVNNPSAGVLGVNVETRSEFENRREATVEKNARGQNQAILGSVLELPNVLDAYVTDNPNSFPVAVDSAASAVAHISGTTLTITDLLTGIIKIGQTVTGTDAANNPVLPGTIIIAGSGTSWTVNNSQNVFSSVLQFDGVILPPNALYVAEVGGDPADVAQAIWLKKPPGVPLYPGNTVETVYDTSPAYPAPGIPYTISWEVPGDLDFVFKVTLITNPGIPSDAQAQIGAAIVAAFSGSVNNTPRATIGSRVLASNFIAPVVALGTWAQVASLLMGTSNLPAADAVGSLGATFTATSAGTSMTVSSVDGFITVAAGAYEGDAVTGSGVPAGTLFLAQVSGPTGGAGVYTTNNSTTTSGTACTATSIKLVISALTDGAIADGQFVLDEPNHVQHGTIVVSQDSGSPGGIGTYTTTTKQHTASEPLRFVVADQTLIQVRINQVPVTSVPLVEVVTI